MSEIADRPETRSTWVEPGQNLIDRLPRMPDRGGIDLTYRCNNNCRHCWLRLPVTAPEQKQELSFDEIRRVADEARAMGCYQWLMSGGEPMLRPDFPEIFDYLTLKARYYSLNTNGTLITPEIARLLTRKGAKMVALYGATAEVHDHITRNPGSFDAVMRGFRYLREAGAGFIVQIVPMRDNYHQFEEMVKLGTTLSPYQRLGATWLHLSALGSAERNAEISRQRLDPKDVVVLDEPELDEGESLDSSYNAHRASLAIAGDDRPFAGCIAGRREFHIDAYGGMTFCSFIKDPALRFDLRKGTFRTAWDEFIPGLPDRAGGGEEYQENCGSCELRPHCLWCGAYAFLEHRRCGAKVESLCAVARENRSCREQWERDYRRFFEIAGITLQVESDLPFTDQTFHPKVRKFQKDGPGPDTVVIRHHFQLPEVKEEELGHAVYRKPPWVIYRQGRSWVYLAVAQQTNVGAPYHVLVFNADHSRCESYRPDDTDFRRGNLPSVTLLATDQILLAQLLADRQACILHSAGVIVRPTASPSSKPKQHEEGIGLLFVGHSEAGKSTIVKLLQEQVEILCDDRNIVRRGGKGRGRAGEADCFRVYGSWSHGEVPLVSAASAPLRAILFIEKSAENRLVPVSDRAEVLKRLLACVIRPLETASWWHKTFSVVEDLVREVPCYTMKFDTSGRIVEQLLELAAGEGKGQGRGQGRG